MKEAILLGYDLHHHENMARNVCTGIQVPFCLECFKALQEPTQLMLLIHEAGVQRSQHALQGPLSLEVPEDSQVQGKELISWPPMEPYPPRTSCSALGTGLPKPQDRDWQQGRALTLAPLQEVGFMDSSWSPLWSL